MIKRLSQPGHIHLCLVGLNFDTADGVRARQVERLERYIKYHFAHEHFAVVIFGDLNNRLVCPDWLAEQIDFQSDATSGPEMSSKGAEELCARLADPDKRLKLMRELDSWTFTGNDASGKHVTVPKACSELRRLFTMHFDICDSAPLPTYKRTPLGEILGRKLGFPIHVKDIVTRSELELGLENLRNVGGCVDFSWDIVENMQRLFFYHDECPVRVPQDDVGSSEFDQQTSIRSNIVTPVSQPHFCAPVIECGWPDKVGVLKDGVMVHAELIVWGTCETLCGSLEHAPLRASVRVVPAQSPSS
jgi:hypothetical protein